MKKVISSCINASLNFQLKSYLLQGWLMKIKIDNAIDVDSLMSEEKYQEYLKTHE
jgi:glycine cleavage system H lipoate-binding protein